MRDVFDRAILVLVPVIHFFENVSLVFFKLTEGVSLDLLDFITLSLQFGVEFLDEIALLFKSFLLFSNDGFLDFAALLGQVFEDLALFLDSGILLSLQVREVLGHLGVDRIQLIVKALDAIVSLFIQEILKVGHPVVSSFVLAFLIFVLGVELVFKLRVHLFELFIVSDLIGLKGIVNFLSFIDSILLDVLNLPVKR